MSWQIASLAIVVAALAACFWWYERTRPSSKEVALVATMAALGALGRDAFAALPDVKPITAIVFICGYAFGPGPGFAVGAVGAHASNIFLGQGSWTPWQMLAWGVVGLGGAALGRLLARRALGRVPLALCCAVAAEVFNLILDLYTWSQGGTHTLAAYGAWLASALSFDLTHVVASFLFGLAFGPALLRMLARARARLEIVWEPAPAASTIVAVVLVALVGMAIARAPARASAASPQANAHASAAAAASAQSRARAGTAGNVAAIARLDVAREIAYLQGAQNADGGFGAAPGQASSELYSGWVAMGLAAAGRDPLAVRRDGHSVLDALRGEASSLEGAGDLERTILALYACGVSVHALPGGDPVKRLLAFRDRDGSFGDLSNLTAFAIFALRAAGYGAADPTVRSAGRWLARQQDADGGFGFGTRGGGSDVDDTAAVLQALVDAGVRSGPALEHATAFLIHAQNSDGGYPQQPGGQSNAQSTAWAIQGLIGAGRDPAAVTREGSRSPLGYLESLVAPDGSVRYSRTGSQAPVWVTAQALNALAGKTFPVAPPRARAAGHRQAPARGRSSVRRHRSARARTPAAKVTAAASRLASAQGATARIDELARAMGIVIGAVLAPLLG
jgi:energy-coupling factor transport system substrate-specific component